ncbi:hypothetical protein KA012_01110 [Candidatus Woesebacteria bacterium]|nr:hypothetical protein [Candidatus Woesebacteria bacterium]
MQKKHSSSFSQHSSIDANRWWMGVIFIICVVLVLWLRLVQLQVIEGDSWADRALQNRLYGSLTAPGRGMIFDRYGEFLTFNQTDYYELLDRKTLFGSTRLLTPDEGLALLATDSAGVRQQFHRLYPLGPAMAHVVGFVTPVTADELAVDREALSYGQTGKQGLEQAFDRQLRGAPGEEQYEISAMGLKRRLVKTTEAGSGAPVETTLDPYLSAVSYRALGDSQGVVVITDVATGSILSLVSSPSFDPNLLTAVSTDSASTSARRSAVQALLLDERQPFYNRAISGTYPLGSIFKIVTAMAALQKGAITATTEVVDNGLLQVGDYSYANWYFTQYGRSEGAISLQKAIARSNDIYFYKAAEAVGPDAIAAMARSLGFGRPVGLGLRSEQAGLVPDPRWKETSRGEQWYLGNTYHFGIGQGDLLVTPVQVAQMMQAISNGGEKCSLHLDQNSRRNCENIGLDVVDLELVLQGMLDACSEGGTAYPFFPWNVRHASQAKTATERMTKGEVACKTGTAEFGGTDEKGYKSTHGWFAMTVGVKDLIAAQLANTATVSAELEPQLVASGSSVKIRSLPMYLEHDRWLDQISRVKSFPDKVSIVVLVESDEKQPYREGSRDAAPVAKEILDWMEGTRK